MPRLLLIAYFYPPLGGPGVQRPVKLVKYLKQFGWQIDVLTVKDIVFHSYDEELAKEDSADEVIRAASFDPMAILKRVVGKKTSVANQLYFGASEKIKKFMRGLFPIDDKIGWLPGAYRAGKKLIKQKKYNAVMATIGPYTSALIAYKLSRKFHIPLIIDYRDHWTLNPYSKHSARVLKNHAEKWEKKILEKATMITTAGRIMKNELSENFGMQLDDKIHVMYNGYDETDFECVKKEKKNNISVRYIRYIGNFYGHQTVKYFIKALNQICSQTYINKKICFEFIGNYYAETFKSIKESNIENISVKPQVDHIEAVELMENSDGLLLFVASHRGKVVLPGKVFEYLRTGKPIFAMVPPEGEAAEILRNFGHDFIVPMEDTEKIIESLPAYVDNLLSGKISVKDFDPIYNRENQTKLFLESLKKKL